MCFSWAFLSKAKDPHFSTAYGAVRVELFSNQKTRSVRCFVLGSHPGAARGRLRSAKKAGEAKSPVFQGQGRNLPCC